MACREKHSPDYTDFISILQTYIIITQYTKQNIDMQIIFQQKSLAQWLKRQQKTYKIHTKSINPLDHGDVTTTSWKIWLRESTWKHIIRKKIGCVLGRMGICHHENFSWRSGWRRWLNTSAQRSWMVLNVSSVSYDWKSISLREATTSILRILFLPLVTSSNGCILEISYNKNTFITTQITKC